MISQRCASIFILALLSSSAFSIDKGQWALDINLASKHEKSTYDNNQEYNENNFGLGLSYGYSESIDFKVGFYDNSYNRTTKYLAAIWQKNYYYKQLRISPGAGIFLVTGYDGTPEFAKKIQPGVIPSLSIGYENVALNIGLVPSVKSNNVATFQLQIKF